MRTIHMETIAEVLPRRPGEFLARFIPDVGVTPLEFIRLPIEEYLSYNETALAEIKMRILLEEGVLRENEIHKIGLETARVILPFWERIYPDETLPRAAIEAREKWLRGELSDDNMLSIQNDLIGLDRELEMVQEDGLPQEDETPVHIAACALAAIRAAVAGDHITYGYDEFLELQLESFEDPLFVKVQKREYFRGGFESLIPVDEIALERALEVAARAVSVEAAWSVVTERGQKEAVCNAANPEWNVHWEKAWPKFWEQALPLSEEVILSAG